MNFRTFSAASEGLVFTFHKKGVIPVPLVASHFNSWPCKWALPNPNAFNAKIHEGRSQNSEVNKKGRFFLITAHNIKAHFNAAAD